MTIQRNVSLQPFNSFGLAARARQFCQVQSIPDLQAILLENRTQPVLVLGGGSNCLFIQPIYPGLVIKNDIKGIAIAEEDEKAVLLKVGGGENWHELVLWCVAHGFGGIENLSLIPGTVGAAPIQNIGAYGVELKDVFEKLDAVSLETGLLETYPKVACDFGYRSSIFKKALNGKVVICQVYLRLSKQNHRLNTSYGAINDFLAAQGIAEPSIAAISEAVIAIRKSKLPDPAVIGNAGSFFKNPEIPFGQFQELKAKFPLIIYYPGSDGLVKIPAGWLIEQCGWKGKRVGNVGCYEYQALVLVNYGGATGEDLKAHADRVSASVLEKFGIQLTPEVNII